MSRSPLVRSFQTWTSAELLHCQWTKTGQTLTLSHREASSAIEGRPLTLKEKASLRAAYYQVSQSQQLSSASPTAKAQRLCEAAHYLKTLELWPMLREMCFLHKPPEDQALYQQLSSLGLFTEQVELCESFIGKYDATADAILFYELGIAYVYLCKYGIATQYFQQLLEWAQANHAIADQIKALGGLGFCQDQWGRHLIAIDYCQQQLALWQTLDPRQAQTSEFQKIQAQTYSILGRAYMFLRKSKQARRVFDVALTLSQKNKDPKSQWYILGRLAFVHAGLGQHKQAIDFLDQQRRLEQETPRELGTRALVLGMTRCFQNDFLGAIQFFQDSIDSSHRAQDYNVQCFAMLALVLINTFQKQYQQAIAIAHDALAIARNLDYYHHECSALFQLSSIYAELEELEPCIFYAESAVAVSRRLAIPSYRASALSALSGSYLLQNQYWKFIKTLRQVVQEMSIPLTRDSKILVLIIIRKIVKHIIRRARRVLKPSTRAN